MRMPRQNRRGFRWKLALLTLMVFALTSAVFSFHVYANPFETVPADHWSYRSVMRLSEKGILREHIKDRLDLGHRFSYIDLSIWMGEAIDRMMQWVPAGDESDPPSVEELIAAYNDAHPQAPLSDTDAKEFADLVNLVDEQLGLFGERLPAGISLGQSYRLPFETSRLTIDSEQIYALQAQLDLRNPTAANLLPNLVVAGEVEVPEAPGGGSQSLSVGAIANPVPELTLGALLYSSESGFRSLFQQEEQTRRIDLSAEIGRWILSLRRGQVLRSSVPGEEELAVFTRVGFEYPLSEHTVLRAGHETGEETGAGSGEENGAKTEVKTELDLEVRFDKGKFGIGFVLQSVSQSKQDGLSSPLPFRTTASLEHAIGSAGTASAGISIGRGDEGSEASSNVALRYDFEDATVMLQYQIYSGVNDPRGVTTAEFTIKF